MLTFLIRRTIGAILVLAVVSFVVFAVFILIPGGDPAQRIAGRTATQTNIENIRHAWGFDRPWYVQYWNMLKKTGNGLRPGYDSTYGELRSFTNQTDVVQQIASGIPATFSLVIVAGLIWRAFGVLVGVIAAVTAGTWSDRAITILALVGISMPVFWLGLVLRFILAEGHPLSIFPDSGYVGLTNNPIQWLYHLLLPWWTLAVLFIGFYGRVMRSNILDTINEDYVRTARAKGLPPIMGVTLFGAFFIVLFTALVDLAYAWLDPRIRPS